LPSGAGQNVAPPGPDFSAQTGSPTSGAAATFAPGLIGDFLGGASARSQVVVDRFIARNEGISGTPPQLDAEPADQPYVVPPGGSSKLLILDAAREQVSVNNDFSGGSFTTALPEREVALLAVDQVARIVDHPTYRDAVTQEAGNDRGGTPAFSNEDSYASLRAKLDEVNIYDVEYVYDYVYDIDIPSPSGGALIGRMKLADNNSPLPRDRVFLDYSFFHNAALRPGGVEVNRFTPGIEKTFFLGSASAELRVPLLITANSNLTLDDQGRLSDSTHGEFGNLAVVLKTLLWRGPFVAVAGGLGVVVPTADDVQVHDADGRQLLRIENESVHLVPYVALLHTPNDFFFSQFFLQIDVDANGNPVIASFPNAPTTVGRLNDQTLLYADAALGAWLYRNPLAGGGLTGLAASLEAHYNRSISNMDSVRAGNLVIGDRGQTVDVVNLTVGLTAAIGSQATATAGYSFPVSGEPIFDGEFRLFINRFF
jgi:hypothetical protein